MARYIDNCLAQINWDWYVTNINNLGIPCNRVPEKIEAWREKADNKYVEPYKSEVHLLVNKWNNAKFNFDFIIVDEWFFPVDHELCQQFGKIVGATPEVAYISRITPGHGIPVHWDIDDCEPIHLAKGTNRRFSCFISDPGIGHMFIIGDQHIHSQPKGAIWEWDYYKTDHIGVNFGLTPKYIFNFLGISHTS